jgi:O-antigen/teichoic acid export membrane protein
MKTIREAISIQTNILISRLPQWQINYINRIIRHLTTPLYRNGYALIINTVGISLLGVLYWILAARYYSIQAVGINSAAIATMTFLASVARLYLDGVLIRFLPRSGATVSRLIGYSYLVSGLMAGVVGLIFIIGINYWAPALGFLRSTPILSTGFLLATVAFTIFVLQDGVLTGLRQAKWVPVENILYALAKLLLLVGLAKSSPDYGIFLSWAIPLLIVLIPVNLLIFQKLLPQHTRWPVEPEAEIGAGDIVQYAGGLYVGYLLSMAFTQLLPLVVLQLEGSSAAAYFTLPWMIITSMQVVIQGMMISLIVEASRDQTQLVKYSRQVLKQIARIVLPMVIILLVGTPYLLHFFDQSYVSESTTLLRLLSLAALPQMFIGLYLGIARVRRLIGAVIVVQAVLFVLGLGLSYFFLAQFGITGIGMAWLISQTVVSIFVFITQLRPLIWNE